MDSTMLIELIEALLTMEPPLPLMEEMDALHTVESLPDGVPGLLITARDGSRYRMEVHRDETASAVRARDAARQR